MDQAIDTSLETLAMMMADHRFDPRIAVAVQVVIDGKSRRIIFRNQRSGSCMAVAEIEGRHYSSCGPNAAITYQRIATYIRESCDLVKSR